MNWNWSAPAQMSLPAPLTVNVPAECVAEPDRVGAPTSLPVHGAGSAGAATPFVTETLSNVVVLSAEPLWEVTNSPIAASPVRARVAEPTAVQVCPSVEVKLVMVL